MRPISVLDAFLSPSTESVRENLLNRHNLSVSAFYLPPERRLTFQATPGIDRLHFLLRGRCQLELGPTQLLVEEGRILGLGAPGSHVIQADGGGVAFLTIALRSDPLEPADGDGGLTIFDFLGPGRSSARRRLYEWCGRSNIAGRLALLPLEQLNFLDGYAGGLQLFAASERLLLVLEGQLELELPDGFQTLSAPALWEVPADVPHRFRPAGEGRVTLLSLTDPEPADARISQFACGFRARTCDLVRLLGAGQVLLDEHGEVLEANLLASHWLDLPSADWQGALLPRLPEASRAWLQRHLAQGIPEGAARARWKTHSQPPRDLAVLLVPYQQEVELYTAMLYLQPFPSPPDIPAPDPEPGVPVEPHGMVSESHGADPGQSQAAGSDAGGTPTSLPEDPAHLSALPAVSALETLLTNEVSLASTEGAEVDGQELSSPLPENAPAAGRDAPSAGAPPLELPLTIEPVFRSEDLEDTRDQAAPPRSPAPPDAATTRYTEERRPGLELGEWVAESPRLRDLKSRLRQLSQAREWIILWGEAGTGRSTLARLLHGLGSPSESPLRVVSCLGQPQERFLEALLGPDPAHPEPGPLLQGLDGGSLLIEGLFHWPSSGQNQVLRGLSELHPALREKLRVLVELDRRPQKGLPGVMPSEFGLPRRGPFLTLELPPLRERPEDIPLLWRTLTQTLRDAGSPVPLLEPGALERLLSHAYPGNLPELQRLARSLAASPVEGAVSVGILESLLEGRRHTPIFSDSDALPTLAEAERSLLLRALRRTGGNKAETARLLDITRTRLYRMLVEHRLEA